MIYINNDSKNPFFNLALEEYLLKYKFPHDNVLILWQSDPAVVVGRNQNTWQEINYRYVRENNIHVARRLSGGGAVYHDRGNLNFTLILDNYRINKNDPSLFTRPIVYCLDKIGIKAETSGRNDILIDQKKISGSARYIYKNKILHHGTLLFNSDLSALKRALKPEINYLSTAVESVRSRVTNIKEHLYNNKIDLQTFKDLLLGSIVLHCDRVYEEYTLSYADTHIVKKLMASKYGTWDWNYGKSPPFTFVRKLSFGGGTLTVQMKVERGIIGECRLLGDMAREKPLKELAAILPGKKYEEHSLHALLSAADQSAFTGTSAATRFISALF